MMKVVGILQSRMTSTRLPGKSLIDIAGKPLTDWIIERVKRSRALGGVVLAVPTEPADDELANHFAGRCGVYRGSLHDVLDRYWNAAREAGADVVVRITGDNPLIDPGIIDITVEEFLRRGVEYAGTSGTPHGIGVEVFLFSALDRAYREATEPYHREHVTPYLYEKPGRFRTDTIDMRPHLHGLPDSVRLTVDTADDLEVAREIYRRLLPGAPEFGVKEIAELYRTDPEIFRKNIHVRQKTYLEAEKKP